MFDIPPPIRQDGRFVLRQILRGLREDADGVTVGNDVDYVIDLMRLEVWNKARYHVEKYQVSVPVGQTGPLQIGAKTFRWPVTLVAVDLLLSGLDDVDKIGGIVLSGAGRGYGAERDEDMVLASFVRINAQESQVEIRLHSSTAGYALEPLWSRLPFVTRRSIASTGSDAGADVEFRLRAVIEFINATEAEFDLEMRLLWAGFELPESNQQSSLPVEAV